MTVVQTSSKAAFKLASDFALSHSTRIGAKYKVIKVRWVWVLGSWVGGRQAMLLISIEMIRKYGLMLAPS